MALWAYVGRVEPPPEVGASVGETRLFPDRLLTYQQLILSRSVPGEFRELAEKGL
jgi:hypothetical protein